MAVKKKKPLIKKAPLNEKAPAKKAVAAKKTSSKAALPRITVGEKPFTKTELMRTLCDRTGVARKEVAHIMETISDVIAAHMRKNGPGSFTWPGLLKIKVVKKPATKARDGLNPFTGEKMRFKAKPASRKPKALPLSALKEMVLA
jgi:nucleoid DNA-binding protein